MSKQHLTDEGVLNPCTADKRACKYAHVSADGSFSEGTSLKDMERITGRLAEQAIKVGTPEAMEQYFHAKTSLEGAKAGTVTVTKAFIAEVTNGKPFAYSLDPQNPDPAIMELIRDRIRTAGTEEGVRASSGAFDLALLGKHPEFADFQVELVQSIQNEETLLEAQERIEPHNGMRSDFIPSSPEMLNAFFHHPLATEKTREHLLVRAKMKRKQRTKLADQMQTGWLSLMNSFSLSGSKPGSLAKASRKAYEQLEALDANSLPAWKLRGYLQHRNPAAGMEHVLRTIDPKTLEDTVIFHSTTATNLVKHGVADSGLSASSKRKVVRMYRYDEGRRSSPQRFINHAGAWGELVNPEPKDAPESVKTEVAVAYGKAEEAHAAVLADPESHSSDKRESEQELEKAAVKFRKANISKVKQELDEAQANASKLFIRDKSEWTQEAKKLEKEYAVLANESRWDVFEASFMD